MNDVIEREGSLSSSSVGSTFDYSYVPSSARIAVYDDLLSSPRIEDIQPDSTREFINALASKVYELARSAGGSIPFSIILQVAENFIHAHFTEMIVSILDSGNTIRFSDQGPGIPHKEKAQQPGYSSANKQMKEYIHGVGSGLPIVKEYLETKHGTIELEDNMNSGAVITISLNPSLKKSAIPSSESIESSSHSLENSSDDSSASHNRSLSFIAHSLSKRGISILMIFDADSVWGVKDISETTGIPLSSTHAELKKIEDIGLVTQLGKKWVLTELGKEYRATI